MLKKLLGAGVVVVVLLGAAGYWFFLRDDAPEELGVDSGSGSEQPTGDAPDTFDGTWTVQAEGDTQAGFRIDEEFAAGAVTHTAVGRSPEVTGEITIEGNEVPTGSFTVDLTTLEFTDDPPSGTVGGRAASMEGQGLETRDFPEGTFELTAPIDLGEVPADGDTVMAEATGDLTLHGVTNEVTFTIEAQVSGNTLRVASTDPVPIVLADYEIEEPSAPFVASVSDEGSFEFLLVFEQA